MPAHRPPIAGFLARLYAEPQRSHAFRGGDREGFEAWAGPARRRLADLVGLDRIDGELGGFEPSVELGPAADAGDHVRHAGVLHAEPAFDTPFWYLLPKQPGPHPLGLFPHGHYGTRGLDYAAGLASSPEMRQRIEREDRDVAVQAARRGFAAIAPAGRGFDPVAIEDPTDRHGGRACRSTLMHALIAGRTVIGERVWDLGRLLDWALARPEIDGSRVLMMGNSGGGVATLYAAACDPRITAAVASCSFCTFVSEGGLLHHCDCNLVPDVLRFGEFHDVAGLIAPRSLLVVHGREDPLFPRDEVDRAMAGLRRIYAAGGADEALRHAVGEGGHRFYGDLMWPWVLEALDWPGTSR